MSNEGQRSVQIVDVERALGQAARGRRQEQECNARPSAPPLLSTLRKAGQRLPHPPLARVRAQNVLMQVGL